MHQKDNMNAKNMSTNAKACTAGTGIKMEDLTACVGGPLGEALLAKSANMTATPPAVVWTPWFELDSKIPGGGKRPIEIDYLKVICGAYTGVPPESCKGV